MEDDRAESSKERLRRLPLFERPRPEYALDVSELDVLPVIRRPELRELPRSKLRPLEEEIPWLRNSLTFEDALSRRIWEEELREEVIPGLYPEEVLRLTVDVEPEREEYDWILAREEVAEFERYSCPWDPESLRVTTPCRPDPSERVP